MSRGFIVTVLILCGATLLLCVAASRRPDYDAKASTNTNIPDAAQSILRTSTPAELATARKCTAAMRKQPSGWSHIDRSGDTLYVVVTDDFLVSSYDERAGLTKLIWCSYTDGRMDQTISQITYQDPRTRSEIGGWVYPQLLTFTR